MIFLYFARKWQIKVSSMPHIIKMHEENKGLLKSQNPSKWDADVEDDNCTAEEWENWVRKSLDARVYGFYAIEPRVPSWDISMLQNSLWKKSSLSLRSKNSFEFEFSQLSPADIQDMKGNKLWRQKQKPGNN